MGFSFSEPFSVRNITRGQGLWTVDCGLAQLSVRADRKKERLEKETTTPTAAETSRKKIIRRLFKNIVREKCVPIMLE